MSDKTMPITGGCLCGAVQFEVVEEPYQTDYCYCRMCQRSSGSVLTTWADIKAHEFRFSRGEIKFYRSSEYAERGFCATCGSTLIQRALKGDWIALATGSLDQPHDFPPDHVHCGAENQPPWLKIDDNLPHKTTKEALGYEVEI